MTDAQYDAWLVDLDGTLYTQRWVKLAMAVELVLFGRSAIKTLRQFRHEHEAMREEQTANRALSPIHESPFAGQLARTAEKLGLPVADVERVVRHWMIERPGKWIGRGKRPIHLPGRSIIQCRTTRSTSATGRPSFSAVRASCPANGLS